MTLQKFRLTFMSSLLLYPLGCGGTLGGNPENSVAGSDGVTFAIMDAPIDDAKNVFITVSGIETRKGEGEWIKFDVTPEEFDLLDLRNGKMKNLVQTPLLTPGTYTETRLILVEDSARLVDLSGESHTLKIPSGSESGLKIKSDIVIPELGGTTVLIDFDLRKSIHSAGNSGKYMMKPVLKIAVTSDIGNLSGTSTSGSLVCAFDQSVESYGADCENATSTTQAEDDGRYLLSMLKAGVYTVVYVEAGAVTKTIKGQTVVAGQTTSVTE